MPKLPRQSLIQAPTAASNAAAAGSATNPSKTVSAGSADTKAANSYIGGDAALTSVNFKPIPNILSDVYSPTYHFSLYLDTDIPGSQGKGNYVVVAETGITGMNVQDVQIESFVGPNLQSRNATATSILVKIFEPYGATLPDLLFQAAIRLGIKNYLKAPWYLNLRFMGYDETSAKSIPIGSNFTWKLLLQDIDSHVSELGAMHTITAIPLVEEAFSNKYCMLPTSAHGSGSTVGDITKQIVAFMNDDSKFRYGDTNPPFIEYSVEDRPYTSDTQVGVSKPFDHKIISNTPQSSNQSSAPDYDSSTGQFAPGTDILAMLDMLFASSETCVKQARLSRELPPATGPDDEKNVAAVNSIMHRVDSVVEYGPYNFLFGDYCKKIKYIVKPYDSLRLLTSVGRAQSFDAEPSLNIKKAQYATDKKFMRKEYQYIFTGLNTEVEKFDITTNFNWSVMVPMLQGYVGGTSSAKTDNTATPAQHAMASSNATDAYEAANKEVLDKQAIVNSVNADTTGTVTQADKAAAATALAAAIKTRDELNVTRIAASQQTTKDSQAAIAAGQLADNNTRASLLGSPYYDLESEVTANAINGKNSTSQTGGAIEGQKSYLPISIVQSAEEQNAHTTTGTANDSNNNNKSLYGALLNQMYGTFSNNLQEITLEIKGDPYWIGPGNPGSEYILDSNDSTPNFLNGEHIFVFRFKLPMGYDETTGLPAVSGQNNEAGKVNSDIFTGFYAVTTVTNKFSQGKFTQTLDATRIPGWSINNILNGDHGSVTDNTTYGHVPVTSGGSATNKPSGAASSSSPNPTSNNRGTRNNNPGNIVDGSFAKRQPGYIGSDGTFAQFDTYADGVSAQETLLKYNYLNHPTTVSTVINSYSPGGDPVAKQNYITSVTSALGKSDLTQADSSALAKAMRQFETGDKNA